MLKSGHPIAGFAGLLLAVFLVAESANAADELYAPPRFDDVRPQSLEWAAGQGVKGGALEAVGRLWAKGEELPSARETFDKVIETFVLVDPRAKRLVETCRLAGGPLLPPEAELLDDENASPFFRANMRLFYARYLAQRKMYDEAEEQFAEIDPKTVVDPAGCLFFTAVCQHQLLMKKEGLKTIDSLLKNTQDVPVSYSSVAKLMQFELQGLKDKSLDEVARMMKDVERRLDLGRGGQRVQKEEDEIIARLDEIIEKLEQQSGGGGGGGGGPPSGNQSSGPAQDSAVGGQTAPGDVDTRNLRNKNGWGKLPPKAEARAKNLINRNFPAHYKQAVEQYLKKLAKRRASTGR